MTSNKSYRHITPTVFAIKMATIEQTSRDEEQLHMAMDDMMCELLESLGYEEGVKIFRNAPKWYS